MSERKYDVVETIHKDLSGVWRCEFCGFGHPTKQRCINHVTSRHWDKLALSEVMLKKEAK